MGVVHDIHSVLCSEDLSLSWSEDEKSCSHAGHSHKSSEDCAICQYSLSFFTEPQPVEFHCTLTLVPYEPVVYQDKVVCKRTYSHQLRAPPVA